MRISQRDYFMKMAMVAAERGNCFRRQVGCVLVSKNNEIIGTGYNGVPRGMPHCTEESCPRSDQPSGTAMRDVCPAVHAEMNALIQCRDIWAIDKIYTTDSPCINCISVLLNTPARVIYFKEEYDKAAMLLWNSMGRIHQKVFI